MLQGDSEISPKKVLAVLRPGLRPAICKGQLAILTAQKGTPKPLEVVEKYAGGGHPVQVRLTALGYYYNVGTPADLPKIADYTGDKTATPKCKADAKDCDWKCDVQSDKGSETKEIKTLGEFVEFCVKPAMEKRGAKK